MLVGVGSANRIKEQAAQLYGQPPSHPSTMFVDNAQLYGPIGTQPRPSMCIASSWILYRVWYDAQNLSSNTWEIRIFGYQRTEYGNT
jgi:hypothetical protein